MAANFADEANWLGLYNNLVMAVLSNPIPPTKWFDELSLQVDA